MRKVKKPFFEKEKEIQRIGLDSEEMKQKMIKENDEKLEEEKQIREEELKLISDENSDLVEEIGKKKERN